MARLMGLDVGSRTVGVAVSDELGWTAQGVEIVRINEDEEQFGIERIAELVLKYDIKGFVLGLRKLLEERFALPVDFCDERLTTVEAERMLVEQADTSRKKRKQVIDKLAAGLILQNYLDSKGKLLSEL